MEAKESSPYVKARAVLLAEYFASRNWYVFEGKNNCILFYIPADQVFDYTVDELADIISESDFNVVETGLRLSAVTYMFFQHAKLVNQVEVWPMTKYDILYGIGKGFCINHYCFGLSRSVKSGVSNTNSGSIKKCL